MRTLETRELCARYCGDLQLCPPVPLARPRFGKELKGLVLIGSLVFSWELAGGGGVETSGILEFPGTGIHICRPHSTLFLFLNIPNTDNALKYYLFINSFESNFIFCTGFFITFEKYSSLEGHKKTRSSSTFAAFKLLRQQEVRM